MSLCCVRATGAAAIAATLNPGKAFYLHEIRVHLSAVGGAGNLTAIVNSAAGAAYDLNVLTADMTAKIDYVMQYDNPMPFENGDSIDVAWANANNRTYGLEIWYSHR